MSIKNRDMETDQSRRLKNIDVFWDDCLKGDPLTNSSSLKNSKVNINNSTNKYKNKKRINYKKKITDQRRRSFVNNRYKKLCEKIPNLYEEEQSNISKNKKSQNSIKRSILLYSYGLEVQKANRTNMSKSKMLKEQEELKLCTWKPKISIYKMRTKTRSKNKKGNRNKSEDNSTKRLIDLYINNECTFRPKINENPDLSLKKIFNKSKSVTLYTDRDNTSFIFRYKKARDEYMIKKFKQLSEKDDSYDTTFVDLTSRVRNKGYKYYLNVNNYIQINDEKIKNNSNDFNNIYFNSLKNNNYNSFYNTNFNANNLSNTNKSKNYYKGLLKEQLRLIDLEL